MMKHAAEGHAQSLGQEPRFEKLRFLSGLGWALGKLLVMVAIVAPMASSAQPIRVDSEARLALTNSSIWRGYIGNSPADGSVQCMNPPIFRWTYVENPLDSLQNWMRSYRLQAGYTPTLGSPVVDVVCSNNFYNFLAPFTNTDGSVYTSPIYWRVIYMNSSASAVMATGAVRTFTLTASATNWNRSMLADNAYLNAKLGVHPHLYFTGGQQGDVLRWCKTSQWASAWVAISNRAFRTITNSWWNQPAATNVYDWPTFITEIALVYRLTTNSTLLAANPMKAANDFASDWLSKRLDQTEPSETKVNCLALMYDWLYPEMTPLQRSNVLYAIESMSRYYLYSYWWFGRVADPSRIYAPPLSINLGSAALVGSSHPIRAAGSGLMCAMAGAGESGFLREFLGYTLNYSIGQNAPYSEDDGSINQGRGYFQGTISQARTAPSLVAGIVFPEARLHQNPRWAATVQWMMHMHPIRFSEVNEPWGDLGGGRAIVWQDYIMRDLVLVSRSTVGWRHYLRAIENKDRFIPPPDLFALLTPFHYPPPGEADANTGSVFPDGGWAISASKPANAYDTFTNGVGFITHARPRGSEVNHSEFTDGEVQMWAYGANVTDGGVGAYRKHPMYHNSLLVDGIGVCLPQRPLHDWFSRLTAWTNTSTFTYVGMDLTRSFNRSNFVVGGYELNPDFAAFYTLNRVPYVANVQRHIVFPRKQYWVIYDELGTTQPATFSWKWNVLEPTAIVDTNNCRFSYTATNHYNRQRVTVNVAHIVDPTTMVLTNLAGTNLARVNPLTGEDYTFTDQDTYPRWNHNIWVSNKVKTTNWHFLSVIYPVKWGTTLPLSIDRVNDNTVHVVYGMEEDTITFERGISNVAVTLDLQRTNARPAVVRGLRVLGGGAP